MPTLSTLCITGKLEFTIIPVIHKVDVKEKWSTLISVFPIKFDKVCAI